MKSLIRNLAVVACIATIVTFHPTTASAGDPSSCISNYSGASDACGNPFACLDLPEPDKTQCIQAFGSCSHAALDDFRSCAAQQPELNYCGALMGCTQTCTAACDACVDDGMGSCLDFCSECQSACYAALPYGCW